MKFFIKIVPIAILLSGCGTMENSIIKFKIGEKYYYIPDSDIVSQVFNNPLYHLDLRGKNDTFRIVYSDKNDRKNYSNPPFPAISYISDDRARNAYSYKDGEIQIVCNTNRDIFDCGSIIYINGVKWALLFNKQKSDEIDSIARIAINQIKGYEKK